MNTDTARQHRDGGWHYVTSNRRTGTHPIGYCSEHGPHATEAEARECYAAWQRDHIRVGRKTQNWMGCAVEGCDKPTKTGADIQGDGFHYASLCDEHLSHEHAVEVLGLGQPAGDSYHS